ncbi:hypothetical protein [Streptomyces jumonjinensis]|uniref:hypothetical protein n=1 Tax=Streptomyces jumonjinensis TaxID=1945 RepID=UPI0037BCCE7C
MTSGALDRKDRARAFVPDLIPEPQDVDRTGPLDARELRDLDRIHAARDHHQAARWMRGKALEAAFRRCLFRGDDGSRTRQQYLDDEWDGISESAAYLEIREWRLAAAISQAGERPAPDSHVRALVEIAEKHGCDETALRYEELRNYAREHQHRVTAKVVTTLATYLSTGEMPTPQLDTLFVPRQLPSQTAADGAEEPFQNFGMAEGEGEDSSSGMEAERLRVNSALDAAVRQLDSLIDRLSALDGVAPHDVPAAEKAVRRIKAAGRWLGSKVTVPEDSVIDAEVVDD